MLGAIDVLAGDFKKGHATGQFIVGGFPTFFPRGQSYLIIWDSFLSKQQIPSTEIETFQVASEEIVKKFWGTLAKGALAGLFLGPIGAAAGLLSDSKKVTFVLKLKDGRRLLGSTDSETIRRCSPLSLTTRTAWNELRVCDSSSSCPVPRWSRNAFAPALAWFQLSGLAWGDCLLQSSPRSVSHLLPRLQSQRHT